MARKTVRIPIPARHPDKLAELVEKVWKQHESMGASSPFNGDTIVNMTLYEELMNKAIGQRKRALELYIEAEVLMSRSRTAFGVGVGQKISAPDTLYHLLDKIKRFLLVKHAGNEEDVTHWGFDVIVGTSRVGGKRKKPAKTD